MAERFSKFQNDLERFIGESYATYRQIDPNAQQLTTIAQDGAISGESDNPIYQRFKSYLVGDNDLIMDCNFIDGGTKLMCRLFFATSLCDLAMDIVININSCKVNSDIAYCENHIAQEPSAEDNQLKLSEQTYDELDKAVRSLSLLERIRKS